MPERPSLEQYSAGYIDIARLIETAKGNIEVRLTDLGATWTIRKRYVWKTDGDFVEIRLADDLTKVLRLPKRIQLTPRLIAFIGLYDGDGNKARNGGRDIGFSQREINIHKFAHDMFLEIFGSQFQILWSILEDTRRFETDEMKHELNELRKQFHKNGLAIGEESDVQKEFIKREFLAAAHRVGLPVLENQLRTPVVSPKKGARAAGKSSLEYIQNLSGSSKFLPLWLKIVRECTDKIILNQAKSEDGSLVFNGPPHEFAPFVLEVDRYIKDLHWRTARGTTNYLTTTIDRDYISIAKSKKVSVIVSRRLRLTPFVFLVCGIYLAEGDTKRDSFFTFEYQPVSLSVALTSSEVEYIEAFLWLLEFLGTNLIESWKVKVGTKYQWETEELAQRLGVMTLRAGEKGQGYLRTLELDRELKNWALVYHPILSKYSHLYHHAEMTGVGIPRVHIIAPVQLGPYFISLVKNLVFDFFKILKYVTEQVE